MAAVPGLIDLLSLHVARLRTIALTHMTLNLIVVALYAVNLWLRVQGTADMRVPVLLSVVAVILLAISGWLGGEMVHVHGVGVEERGDALGSAQERARQERWNEKAASR